MRKHDLKILPEYFEKVIDGSKTFEVRYNDRGFQEGDIVILNEVKGEIYTGREVIMKIGYILEDSKYNKKGYVTFSLINLKVD